MNSSEHDSSDLFNSFRSISVYLIFSCFILILPFYAGWALYFLNEIIAYRRLLRRNTVRPRSNESDNLIYQYRGEYYKYILMFIILLLEPCTLFSLILALFIYVLLHIGPLVTSHCKNTDVFVDLIGDGLPTLTYILSYIILFLLCTLTIHMVHYSRFEFRNEQFTPIKRRLAFLALVVHILAIIMLAFRLESFLFVKMICQTLLTYEFISFLKHSKILYYLLKWRSQDISYLNNQPLYNSHRRIAQRYKIITVYFLTCIGLILASGYLDITSQILDYNCDIYKYINLTFVYILKYTVHGFGFLGFALCLLFIIIFTLYYFCVRCWNRIDPMFGRNKIHFSLQESLLQ